MTVEFVGPQPTDVPAAPPAPLLAGMPVAESTADVIWTASASAPRTLQPEIGVSELGLACSRQIAYRLAGVKPGNMTVDPLASVTGTAMHAWLSEVYRTMRPEGRYLIDHRVSYRGVPGTLDLYDRRTRRVIDWKFPRKSKARRMSVDGPPRHYRWQVQVYAAALEAVGERPSECAVVWVPVDGSLDDVSAWCFPYDVTEANDAVDRLGTVRQILAERGGNPGAVEAQPSRLCPWCPYHRPQWPELDSGCPGER